jgi:hypothetical protein
VLRGIIRFVRAGRASAEQEDPQVSITTTTVTASTITASDIVLDIDTIDQLFNAPAINPFSDKIIDVLGESAITRLRRRLLAEPLRKWDDTRLVIRLPPDQITPGLQQQTLDAVRRYVDAKIEDNRLSIHLSRTLGLIALLIVSLILIVVLGLTSYLFSGPLAGLGEDLRSLLVGFVGVFAWVMLWDPLSKLLFEWVGPRLENRMLQRIRAMPIVIQPQSV